jgi:hypothetical protein
VRDWIADADTVDYTDRVDRVLHLAKPPIGVARMTAARTLPGRAAPPNMAPPAGDGWNERPWARQTPPQRRGRWTR